MTTSAEATRVPARNRRRSRDWNLRACSRHGHVHYLPAERWAAFHVTGYHSADGGLLHRCWRCGEFTRVNGTVASGPLADAPVVARDRELRDRFVMRLLAAERGVRGLLVLLLGVAVFVFRSHQPGLRAGFDDLLPAARPLADKFGIDVDHGSMVTLAHEVLNAGPNAVLIVGWGLIVYGLVQLAEGVGLWLAHRWGEYLSVVATSVFLPFEVYEVIDKASPFKAGALVLNLVALVWLVWTKRLFGLRGGHEALVASRRGTSLLPTAPPAD